MSDSENVQDASMEKISRMEMEDARLRSVDLMEPRTRQEMEESGFHVEGSPAYRDPVSGRSREYDLSAVTTFDLPLRNQSTLSVPDEGLFEVMSAPAFKLGQSEYIYVSGSRIPRIITAAATASSHFSLLTRS